MNIDSFLKFFVPKDHSFFPLFESDAQNLVKAADTSEGADVKYRKFRI